MSSLLRTPKWLAWSLSLGWAALIFLVSSSPDALGGQSLLDLVPYGDKLAHALAFGILAVFLYLATGHRFLALLLSSVYGLSDEYHQSFVIGRSASLGDWLADTLGALLALTAVRFLTWRHKTPHETLQ